MVKALLSSSPMEDQEGYLYPPEAMALEAPIVGE
jgi:hypothetical protein